MKTLQKKIAIAVLLAFFILSFMFATYEDAVAEEPQSGLKDCYSTFMTACPGGSHIYSKVDCGPCTLINCYAFEDSGRCHNYTPKPNEE